MLLKKYKNSSYALVDGLETIFRDGNHIPSRGSATLEIAPVSMEIEHPAERCYLLPHRRDNVFHKIAETLWVMAGMNDLDYLERYLPSCRNWSDDGNTWRAGYGSRLRNYHGVDQFKEVIKILNNEPYSRRAVMSIFDPSLDYCDSRDIPCNNWLNFQIRPGDGGVPTLMLNVAQRSSDAIFGFSGINTFEWSVLMDMMGFWTNSNPGMLAYNISSFHLYERHYAKGREIVDNFPGMTIYECGIKPVQWITVPFDDFRYAMGIFFSNEKVLWTSGLEYVRTTGDKFLDTCVEMLNIYMLAKVYGYDAINDIVDCVDALDDNDFKAAAIEYLFRTVNTGIVDMLHFNEDKILEHALLSCTEVR